MSPSNPNGGRSNKVRAFLTIYTTLQVLALILVFGMGPHLPAGFRVAMDSKQALEIVELLLPVFSGYVGLIVGFYFGTKDTHH
jgi:hypothetical protein